MQFHPRNDKMFLVCPMRHPAVLVHVDASHEIIPMDDEVKNQNYACSRKQLMLILFI